MPAIARWSRGGGRPFPPLSEAGPTADPGVVACGWLPVGWGGGGVDYSLYMFEYKDISLKL